MDTKRIEYSEPLMTDADAYAERDTDTDTDDEEDEEQGAYNHYGGSLSGKGMAHDPPHIREAMFNAFAQHPEVLATYIQGQVPNPAYTDLVGNKVDTQADHIDYGGSLSALSHSENGYLVAHDSEFPHEFHIV